ncbi:MAG: SurA N-terminal domain-containing protein [Desulfobaccales bacterium]
MLKILRKHSKHWLIGAIVGAIVVVFIFWGIGTKSTPQSKELARVYGNPIPLTTFYQYVNLVEKKARFRRNLSEEEIKALRDGAPDDLIRLVLLTEKARRLGLTVTDSEVQAAILRDPDFQQDNAFDPRLYEFFIGRGRNREAEKVAYEKWLRQQILAAKVLESIVSFAKVTDLELQEFFRLGRETVQVDYLEISPESFLARVKPDDRELKAYYDLHQAELRAPEKVKVRYVLCRVEDMRKQAEVSSKEVEDYVRENRSELVRPKVIRAREIFLALNPKAQAGKRQKVQQQASELLEKARQGGDFAQMARTSSQDEAGRSRGGDLGPVPRGKKGEAWDKVAFALEAGQVGLAQTAKGFHIIKVEDIQETEPLPDAEAKARVRQLLLERKSRDLARQEAKRLQGETARTPFLEVVQKSKLNLQETPLFSQTDPVPGLGLVKAFNQEAFTLKPQEVGLAEVPQGFAVMQALERQPAQTPPFEQVKEKVRQEVARRTAQKLAGQEAERLLNRLRQGEPLAKVTAQAALPLRDSGPFTRLQGFRQQPLAEPLTSAAFQLSLQQPYPDKPIFWKGKYYLLSFKNRRLPTQEDFHQERSAIERRVLEDKRQVLLEAWFRDEWQRAQVSKPGQGG